MIGGANVVLTWMREVVVVPLLGLVVYEKELVVFIEVALVSGGSMESKKLI